MVDSFVPIKLLVMVTGYGPPGRKMAVRKNEAAVLVQRNVAAYITRPELIKFDAVYSKFNLREHGDAGNHHAPKRTRPKRGRVQAVARPNKPE